MKTYINLDNGNVFKVDEHGAIWILSGYDSTWMRSSRNNGRTNPQYDPYHSLTDVSWA